MTKEEIQEMLETLNDYKDILVAERVRGKNVDSAMEKCENMINVFAEMLKLF